MGNKQTKKVDNTGVVNNNITMNVYSLEIIVLLSVIVAIKALEFAYLVYYKHKRHLKKVYSNRPPV